MGPYIQDEKVQELFAMGDLSEVSTSINAREQRRVVGEYVRMAGVEVPIGLEVGKEVLDGDDDEEEEDLSRSRYLIFRRQKVEEVGDVEEDGEEPENENDDFVGFVHFRLTPDNDNDEEDEVPSQDSLYVFEIQLDETVRGAGLGSKAMSLLEEMGREMNTLARGKSKALEKVCLTVFKCNQKAVEFYEKIGYKVDNCDPSNFGTHEDYIIMSKALL